MKDWRTKGNEGSIMPTMNNVYICMRVAQAGREHYTSTCHQALRRAIQTFLAVAPYSRIRNKTI